MTDAATPALPPQHGSSCSRCTSPLDTDGYPKWCKACRAKNRREYEATRKEMSESRGFAAGVSAAREYFAGRFEKYGAAAFTGIEIGALIRQSQGPAAVEPAPTA